eukprot:TRINITY_DN2349_c0_g1_i1.p1 TRINITY_DN2349_c0_g1~~TRINITY_DN2349_c0_g1_i1.p1  ORF type:complete len:151 (-),score=26.37 TRINITY_DN2349_c0_g1_i1:66-518(-)
MCIRDSVERVYEPRPVYEVRDIIETTAMSDAKQSEFYSLGLSYLEPQPNLGVAQHHNIEGQPVAVDAWQLTNYAQPWYKKISRQNLSASSFDYGYQQHQQYYPNHQQALYQSQQVPYQNYNPNYNQNYNPYDQGYGNDYNNGYGNQGYQY